MKLSEIRQKFPMYADIPDEQLIIGIHRKFYSDMPFAEFNKKIEYDKRMNPTEGMSGLDKVTAGFQQAYHSLSRGVRDFASEASQSKSIFVPETLRQINRFAPISESEVAEARKLDEPLLNTPHGMGGAVAGNVVAAATLPGATLPGALATGGALNFFQPTVAGESRVLNTAAGVAGGGLGYGAGRLVGKAFTPSQSTLTASQTRAIERGQQLGMKVTPGVRTGSHGLRGVEASMESFPFTSGPIKRIKQGNQVVLNRSAAKTIGETADELTDDVLNAARTRIGAEFNKVERIQSIPIGQDTANKLASIETKYRGLLEKPLVEFDVVKDIYANLGKPITGKQYNDWQSQLGKIARAKFTGGKSDPNVGFALFEVKNALDDAAAFVMTGAEKQAFQTARQQWKNLVMLETGNVVNEQTGNVSGRLAANVLSRKDKQGFRLGGNTSDFYDAVRFYKAAPDIVGDSGTATRSALPWMLGQSAISGGAAGGLSGDPGVGAMGLLAPLGLALLARGGQAAYLSRAGQGYLTNQLLPASGQRWLGYGGGLLGAQVPLLGQ